MSTTNGAYLAPDQVLPPPPQVSRYSPGIRLSRTLVDLRCLVVDLARLRDQLPAVCADQRAAGLAQELDTCAHHIRAFLETERETA